MNEGYRIRYTRAFNGGLPHIHLVPFRDQPLFVHRSAVRGRDECPTCGIIHPVKTVHLTLDSTGSCIVSGSVLEALRAGVPYGLEKHDLEFVEVVPNPPSLTVDGRPRRQIDQENEAIKQWSS